MKLHPGSRGPLTYCRSEYQSLRWSRPVDAASSRRLAGSLRSQKKIASGTQGNEATEYRKIEDTLRFRGSLLQLSYQMRMWGDYLGLHKN